ncbi:MAG: 4-hydroxy-3-methylbut-2-enyl diphosphate reductase [Candidatus Aminicenantes bacterium RBG_16_63_16]|nr:MAG: 4-hydroxy-3-methylbut-2-enyl diphosphate reductase [Candidatus Aminicenantes bacterium RBG_16_63_16]
MEIIIASHSGLCYGVKRALTLAKQTRRRRSGRVMTLGELIHNPRVIADLKTLGIESVDDPAAADEGTVVIRSHGVAPDVYRVVKKRGIEVVDATCPIVKRIQQLVEGLARRQADIVIVGDPAHPEIRGLLGCSRGRGQIVENEDQARRLPRRKERAVLAQSTQDGLLFGRVVAALLERTEKLEVYNTICRSTQTRQKAASDLAARVDVLFIVGGRNSSNTRKLYEISKRILPATYFIENAGQITPRLLRRAKVVGISGGASTPPEAIAEAVAKIRNSFEHSSQRENRVQCQS